MKLKLLCLIGFVSIFSFTIETKASAVLHVVRCGPGDAALALGLNPDRDCEEVEINVEGNRDVEEWEWVVNRDEEILEKQTGMRFRQYFNQAGEYLINLNGTLEDGQIRTTEIRVIVSEGEAINPSQLTAKLETIPEKNLNNEVVIEGDSKKVFFISSASIGNISEYRLDIDTAKDSDGDGNPANDIDNQNHPSLSTGESVSTTFKRIDGNKEVKLEVLSEDGETASETVQIVFTGESNILEPSQLKARLSAYPPADDQGRIFLTPEQTEVTFYAGDSTGDIRQYQIDANLQVDSNGDGNPRNDIDNRDHPSFTTGEMWSVSYNFEEGREIKVRLAVVSPEGQGDTLERTLVFTESPPIAVQPEEDEPLFLADRTQIFTGQEVSFSAINVPANSEFAWDFEGDGIFDETTLDPQVTYQFTESGNYQVTLEIRGPEVITLTQEIEVKTQVDGEMLTDPPVADFSYTVDTAEVSFINNSRADQRLDNGQLDYFWEFGDNTTSSEENPVHKYTLNGDYEVVLTVVDSVGRTAKMVETVVIDSLAEPVEDPVVPPQDPADPDSPQDPADPDMEGDEGFQLTGFLIGILVFIGLILLASIYFIVEKVKHPSLTFGEILEGLRERFTGKSGEGEISATEDLSSKRAEQVVDAQIVQSQEKPQKTATETSEAKPATSVAQTAAKAATGAAAAGATAAAIKSTKANQGKTPDWLKTPEDKKPTSPKDQPTVNSKSDSTKPSMGPGPENTGKTPEWLNQNSNDKSAQTSGNKSVPLKAEKQSTAKDLDIDKNQGKMPPWLQQVPEGQANKKPPLASEKPAANLQPNNTTKTPDWLKENQGVSAKASANQNQPLAKPNLANTEKAKTPEHKPNLKPAAIVNPETSKSKQDPPLAASKPPANAATLKNEPNRGKSMTPPQASNKPKPEDLKPQTQKPSHSVAKDNKQPIKPATSSANTSAKKQDQPKPALGQDASGKTPDWLKGDNKTKESSVKQPTKQDRERFDQNVSGFLNKQEILKDQGSSGQKPDDSGQKN
jgi:PKD repeat protein